MKEHEFLALKTHEFLEMIEAIARERQTLKTKKRTDDSVTLTCHLGIPVSHIRFNTEEQGENLLVTRKVNLLPLFYSSLPIFILLEVIIFLISHFRNVDNIYFRYVDNIFIYILVALTWIIAIGFLIYQTFADLEEIVRKLYRIEV
ncbi:MAG: hypothetical protein H7641_11715 [Candidatus Heimdallarchaeota archaeon]|nr:hypothetical protein [Candidatus Heimdallarchaeota archaeon]MCK4878227.1 hypothetical protein [Candidatus Heimdallarchaeota archaeon]